jgi:plastocyanin
MKKNRITTISAVLLITVLVLAACSSGGSSSGGTTTLKVDATEFAFNPANVTVPAGASVTLTLNNTGTVDHTWVILKQGVNVTTATGLDPNSIYFASSKVAAGQSGTFNFTAPSTPGDYEIICDLPGHLEGGMKGTLTVK